MKYFDWREILLILVTHFAHFTHLVGAGRAACTGEARHMVMVPFLARMVLVVEMSEKQSMVLGCVDHGKLPKGEGS